MPYLTEFITVATVHLLAVMSPGPDFMMVTRNTLVYSRRAGIFSSIGLGLGIGVHIAYSLLGIGLLISKSVLLFNIMKYLGAAYLFYIGYQSLISKGSHLKIDKVAVKKDMKKLEAVKIGFITNVTNPKATLFFLALFTQVINPATPIFIQLLYGIEMTVATAAWFIFVSYVFSHHVIKSRFEKVQNIAEKAMGIALIGLGIRLALSSK